MCLCLNKTQKLKFFKHSNTLLTSTVIFPLTRFEVLVFVVTFLQFGNKQVLAFFHHVV